MRPAFKLVLCAAILSSFVARSALAALYLKDKALRRRRVRLTQSYCRLLLKLFGVRVTLHAPDGLPQTPVLLITNHTSYLDVLVLSSHLPAVFVTSVEVHDEAILGTLCRKGGSRFVERRSRSFLIDEIETIKSDLLDGFTVCVFPEGTTTDGSQLLPFRRSLLEAAAKANVPVLPGCINYRTIDGKPVSRENRDRLFYYGDAQFFPHLQGLLKTRQVEVEVRLLPPLSPSQNDRKEIATFARSAIERHLTPI